MTLPIDQTTLRGALFTAVKAYPGGVRQFAADLDLKESSLYARLRGEKGYPLDVDDLDDILGQLRSREVPGWARCVQVFCHKHDHLGVAVPRSLREGDIDGLRQVSQMMQEVAEIAQELAAAQDERKSGGKLITSKEMKRIEQACDEAMEKIAETREYYRALHQDAKGKGLIK